MYTLAIFSAWAFGDPPNPKTTAVVECWGLEEGLFAWKTSKSGILDVVVEALHLVTCWIVLVEEGEVRIDKLRVEDLRRRRRGSILVISQILFFCSALVSNSRFVSKCANIQCSHLLISFFLAVQFRMSKAMKTKSPLLRCTPMKQVRKLHNLDCTLSAVVCSSRNIIASCVVPSPQLCRVVFVEETSLYAQYLTEYRKHSHSQAWVGTWLCRWKTFLNTFLFNVYANHMKWAQISTSGYCLWSSSACGKQIIFGIFVDLSILDCWEHNYHNIWLVTVTQS